MGLAEEIQFSLAQATTQHNDIEPSFDYTLSCGGNYVVTGKCDSKKNGQNLAAQAMLKVCK